MNRNQARIIARDLFPCNLYGTNYKSLGELIRKDRIAYNDLLDHIEFNEPLTEGSFKKYHTKECTDLNDHSFNEVCICGDLK